MLDIQQTFNSFALLGATWVMWLLVVLSILAFAVILERAYYLIRSHDNIAVLRDGMLKRLGDGDVDGAKRLLGASQSFEAKIVKAGVDVLDDGPAAAEDRMASETGTAKLFMERNLAFLGTVGANAPFVGLLGTVIGIIKSFVVLQEGGGQVSAELFYEVGEALVATAIGILVAIPAVAFFNLFQRIIKARISRADSMSRALLAWMKRNGRETPAAAPAEAE
jgi:biopolymer transport protein ExbB